MITLTHDPEWFNDVANHPKVRPWLAPPGMEGYIDVSPLLERRRAIGLRTDHGGFLLLHIQAGIWEPHAFFLPQEDRLARAVADMKEFQGWFFKHHPTDTLEVKVPKSSAGTNKLAVDTGFKPLEHLSTDDKFHWYMDLESYNCYNT